MELKKIEKKIEVLYNRKLERSIRIEEFKREYSLISEERNKLNLEIKKIEREKTAQKDNSEVRKTDTGIMLVPLNPAYAPMIYSNEEIKSIPIIIAGIVKQLKREF